MGRRARLRGRGRPRRLEHLHRQEHRHLRCHQHTVTHLSPPGKHQALTHAVSGRDSADEGTRLVALGNNPKLVRRAPASPTFPPSDEFHHAFHRHTLTTTLITNLRRRAIHSRRPSAEGYTVSPGRSCFRSSGNHRRSK